LKELKVLQITDSLNVGGTEVLAVNMANVLLDYNISSHFCTTRQEGFLKGKLKKEVSYIHLKRKYILDIKALIKLKKYIKTNQIHIVHAHSTSLFFACVLKMMYPNFKLFWHNHTGANVNLSGLKFYIIKFLTKFTNGIVNVNEELAVWSKNKLGNKNVIQVNNFPLFTDTDRFTNLHGVINKKIVCLAALRPEKDHLNLLEAFNIVQNKFPDWTLHLIGKDYNNEYSDKIKRYISNNNLKENVFIYDMCSDIKNILKQVTIGVLSSENEGLPISLLEYGLANLPVLITDVGECKKVINHHKAIVISKRSDIFANALIEIIKDDSLRNEISKSLNTNVLLKFSKENFILKIKKMYTNNDK
jgi:glycosyltransferase involved in cell wall biosynthesis